MFLRSDLENAEEIKALSTNIGKTTLNTAIGNGENSVSTIEHLMAAFVGFGIDNALVKIDGPEVPILDGSALEYMLKSLKRWELKRRKRELEVFKIKKELTIKKMIRFLV